MGPVVFCFGVVDEADIIGDFIEYHLRLGVDAFVATDVGSTDGTLDVLSRYERCGKLHLTRYQDPTVHAQVGGWQAAMVATAKEHYRAEWCLFGDPDEFWVIPNGDARAYLAKASSPIIIFPRYNMVPDREYGSTRIRDFRNFELVVRRPLEFLYDLTDCETAEGVETLCTGYAPDILRFLAPKVAARADAIQSMSIGYHDAIPIDPGAPRYREQAGYIAHFPVRSLTQFRHKAALVARFMDINPPSSLPFSRHWVRMALLYRHGLIDEEFARQVLDDEEIAFRLSEGIISRDPTVATRLGKLTSELSPARTATTGV